MCTITSDTSGVNIATINPFRYRGYYFDTESNFYYLQSRYYDPVVGRFINADAAEFGIDLEISNLNSNLFTYCYNNVVNMIDTVGYSPKYISEQKDSYEIDGVPMKNIRLGLFGNIADNGCGVIAAYNVIISRSSNYSFNDVKKDIVLRGGLIAGGYLGVNPNALRKYMLSKFRGVLTGGPNTYFWGLKAELSESVIVLINWGEYKGMHYIAGIGTGTRREGGSFKFYNSGLQNSRGKSIDGIAMSIWDFLEYVKSKGATPIYFIGVRWKRGRW